MKKSAFLFVAATFALSAVPVVQAQMSNNNASTMQGTEVTGRLSNAPHSTPAAAAKTNGKVEAFLAKDEKGKSPASTFSSADAAVYLVTRNVSGAKGDKVRVVWVADDTGKALPKAKKLTDAAIALPDTASHDPFFNQPAPLEGKFPPGSYHVDLYVGSALLKSLKFTVK